MQGIGATIAYALTLLYFILRYANWNDLLFFLVNRRLSSDVLLKDNIETTWCISRSTDLTFCISFSLQLLTTEIDQMYINKDCSVYVSVFAQIAFL